MKTLFKTILFIFISLSVKSQNIDKQKLDNYFKAIQKSNKFMGSVALLKDGKIIYTNQLGYCNIESKIAPNKSSKYRIGSISKMFTATLILKSIEEKKLSLNQTINEFFPSIKNSKFITIANLLNHSSGIHNFTNEKEYLEYNTTKKSREQMITIIKNGGSDFKPGKKNEYSNSNYVLLSYILQDIYSKPFSEILHEKIVKPLDLKNTFFGSKININKNECYSYTFNIKVWKKEAETDVSIPMGAGAIISSPSDLVLFAHALFNYKIISKESIEKMKTLQNNYGMGLFKIPFETKVSYGHTGGIDGFSSVLGYFSKEGVGFALTSNGSNYDNNKISITLLSSVFNKPYEIPSFKTIEISSEELDQYLGVYKSDNFPLDITITKIENILVAQATGQPSFRLEATEKNTFKFDQAGIVFKFFPEKNELLFSQGGAEYILIKK